LRGVRLIVHLLLAWLAAALLGRYLTGGHVLLDPFLLVTVYYGIRSKPPTGTLVGLSAGLLQDALTGTLFGLNGFSKTLVGFLCHLFGGRLLLNSPVSQVVILLSCTLVDRLVVGCLGFLLRGTFGLQPPGALVLLSLANAAVGLILFRAAESRRRRAAIDAGY